MLRTLRSCAGLLHPASGDRAVCVVAARIASCFGPCGPARFSPPGTVSGSGRRCEEVWRNVYRTALGRPGGDRLSHALRRSTMGAEAFHGRVRDGIGWGRLAMTTRPTKGSSTDASLRLRGVKLSIVPARRRRVWDGWFPACPRRVFARRGNWSGYRAWGLAPRSWQLIKRRSSD